MNKKLRRFLKGRRQSDPKDTDSKKKRKEDLLPFLHSQRQAVDQNYYSSRDTNQQPKRQSASKDVDELKKSKELIVDTDESDNNNQVIEVILEPIRENPNKITLEHEQSKSNPHFVEDKTTTLSLSNNVVHSTEEITHKLRTPTLKVVDLKNDKPEESSTSSKVSFYDAPRPVDLQQVRNSFIETAETVSPAATNEANQSQATWENQPQKLNQVRRDNLQSCASFHEDSLSHCSHHRSLMGGRFFQSTAALSTKCQHCSCGAARGIEQPPSTLHINNCSMLFNRCGCGSFSNDRMKNQSSSLVLNGHRADHPSHLNMHTNSLHGRCCNVEQPFHSSRHITSSLCTCANHFNVLDESSAFNCRRCRNTNSVNQETSNPTADCHKINALSFSPHACGCNYSSFTKMEKSEPKTAQFNATISFSIQDEDCSTKVFEIPCLPQENEITNPVDPSISFYKHQNPVSDCSVNLESQVCRTCERHATETVCNSPCIDSFTCHNHRFCTFNSNHRLHLQEDSMTSAMTLLPNVQNLSRSPSCYCRRAAANTEGSSICESNRDWISNNRYSIIQPVKTSYNRTFTARNTQEHFQLSSKAYAKLIAYCHSKKLLTGMINHRDLPYNTNVQRRNSFNFPSERTLTRAYNEYSELGQCRKQARSYENQAAIEMFRLARAFETVEECPWYYGELSGQEAKEKLSGSPVGTFLLRNSSEKRYLFSLSLMTRKGPTSIRIVFKNGIFRFESDQEQINTRRRMSAPNAINSHPEHRQCVIHMILHYTKHLTEPDERVFEIQSNPLPSFNTNLSKNVPRSFLAPSAANAPIRNRSNINNNDDNSVGHQGSGQFMCSWVSRGGRREIQVLLAHPHPNKGGNLQELCRRVISKKLSLWKSSEKIEELPLPTSLKEYVKKYPYPI